MNPSHSSRVRNSDPERISFWDRICKSSYFFHSFGLKENETKVSPRFVLNDLRLRFPISWRTLLRGSSSNSAPKVSKAIVSFPNFLTGLKKRNGPRAILQKESEKCKNESDRTSVEKYSHPHLSRFCVLEKDNKK